MEVSKGEIIAIDGKTLRRSFRNAGNKAFVHMVSAWAAHNRVVLGQIKTDEVLTTVHVGPYTTLGETWEAVFAHAAKLNRNVSKSSWEWYLNTPEIVAPGELRTEIFVPLDP